MSSIYSRLQAGRQIHARSTGVVAPTTRVVLLTSISGPSGRLARAAADRRRWPSASRPRSATWATSLPSRGWVRSPAPGRAKQGEVRAKQGSALNELPGFIGVTWIIATFRLGQGKTDTKKAIHLGGCSHEALIHGWPSNNTPKHHPQDLVAPRRLPHQGSRSDLQLNGHLAANVPTQIS